MVDMKNIIRKLEAVTDLPTLPIVYAKVSALVNDSRTTAAQVARVIESDQAITSKILRLVNSSFFGFSRRISSIHQAVILLGFNTIRNTVLSISVSKMFETEQTIDFDLKNSWKHSIATGLLTKSLGRHLDTGMDEEAFAAGILHDIGKVVLNKYFPDEFGAALEKARSEQLPLFDAERQVNGVSHAEIGEYIVDHWNLPYGLVEAVALHHTPSVLRSNPKLVCLVHVANIFAREMQIGFNGDFRVSEIDPFVYEELEVSEDDLNGFYMRMKEEIEENQEIFNILS